MTSSLFWDITPCSPVKINSCFGGTYRYHLQGRIVSQATNQGEAGKKQIFILISCWAYPEDGGDISSETSADFHLTTRRYISQSQLWEFQIHYHVSNGWRSYSFQWMWESCDHVKKFHFRSINKVAACSNKHVANLLLVLITGEQKKCFT
jgi:hypothetical protein